MLPSLKLTWNLKIDGWKMNFLLECHVVRCEMLVSGKVGICWRLFLYGSDPMGWNHHFSPQILRKFFWWFFPATEQSQIKGEFLNVRDYSKISDYYNVVENKYWILHSWSCRPKNNNHVYGKEEIYSPKNKISPEKWWLVQMVLSFWTWSLFRGHSLIFRGVA